MAEPPSRNAPCHCGSGRKYKRCCYARDRASDATAAVPLDRLGDEALAMVEAADRWEVDVVPLPIRFETEQDARPGCFLATGAGYVLSFELFPRPTGEVEELAELMAERLVPLLERVGGGPRILGVRHASVARALAPLVEPLGASVEFAGRLDELEDAADSLIRRLTGEPMGPGYASSVDRWAG